MTRLACMLLLLFPLLAFGQENPLKVMSFNIRYDNEGDGVNRWDNRKDRVVALLRKYDPDVIGLQEALHHQLTDLEAALKGYIRLGVGRVDGKQEGEYSAILLRKKRFKVRDHGTFWLSETPSVPGSKSWDAALTRVATWAKLRDRVTGHNFLMINTHFDHRGTESRRQAAQMLKDSAASMGDGLPVMITGDLNFTRDKEPYAVLMAEEPVKLVDPAPANPPGTFCNFGVGSQPCNAIDYVLYTTHWQPLRYQVIDDNDGTWYPSDHLPVMVTVTLP